jgi:alkylhydroperoxidase family enzyme
MHTKDARSHGETEERIYLLDAWHETRERAALAWTEALTLIAQTHAPDEVYNEVRRHFSPEETVKLSLLIVTINGWNRLAIAARALPQIEAAQNKPARL